MINIEITLKNVSAKDYKVIMFLHKITEDSLYAVQWRISQGLPVFSNTVSYYDCYDKDAVIARLIDYFQKNNIDVIINRDGKKETLNEFLDFVDIFTRRIRNIEITLKNVSAKDDKVIASLCEITGDSLSELREKISQGLPVFSNEVSFSDCYKKNGIIARLMDCFQKNNIDAVITHDGIIDHDGNKETLNEFLKGWNETITEIEDIDKKDLQRDSLREMYRDFLDKEGYDSQIDTLGKLGEGRCVVFKYQGDVFLLDAGVDDDFDILKVFYFEIVEEHMWEDSADGHLQERLDRAASETNAEALLTKTYIMRLINAYIFNRNKVIFSIESIVKNHEEFKHNIKFMLEEIQFARKTFREKMKNGEKETPDKSLDFGNLKKPIRNIEITLKNVSAKDNKVIVSLHKILEDPLSAVKWKISQGLPVFSNEVSYVDYYVKGGVIERLMDFFQKSNIDGIIDHDGKKETLKEFLKGWNEDMTRGEDGRKKELQRDSLLEMYRDFLIEKGYDSDILIDMGYTDEEFDPVWEWKNFVVFNYQDDIFRINLYDDLEFFRIVHSGIWEDPSEEHLQERLDRAASETNAETILTKIFIVGKNRVVVSIESMVKNHEEFKHNINGMLDDIQSARDTFREKMKK